MKQVSSAFLAMLLLGFLVPDASATIVPAQDYKQVAIHMGIDPSTVVGGARIEFDQARPHLYEIGIDSSSDYYVTNPSAYEILGARISTDSFLGPAPVTQKYTTSLATTVSGEISWKYGMSAFEIAGKLGIAYQDTVTKESIYGPVNVPAGRTYTFYAWKTYNHYTYKLWYDGWFSDTYQGTYWYDDPKGIYVMWQDTTA